IDTPDGIKAVEVVFPTPAEFLVPGYPQPQLVFENQFDIGVPLAIAKTRGPGPVSIPVHVRYQACNDSQCFQPRTVDAVVEFRVAAANEAVRKEHQDVFSRIAFGHGDPPAESLASPAIDPARAARSPEPSGSGTSEDPLKLFDSFEILDTKGGYM